MAVNPDSVVETAELAPGYAISRIIKGGWQLSTGHGAVDYERAVDDMAAFVEAGITAFDCADIYTGVEELIGRFVARRRAEGRPPGIRIHTKFVPDLDVLATLDRGYVGRIIDRSLRRLGVERLDLVQFSWWDYAVPRYVEVMGWLDDLRRAGKIERLGVTNFNTASLAEILEAGIPVVANQLQYSLLDDRPARGMVELCRRHGIGLLCYGTVAGGFLSERWLGQAEPTGQLANRSLVKYKLIIDDFGGWAPFQALLETLKRIADRHGASITNVATRWILDRPQVAAAIIGARNIDHLTDNLRVFALRLDDRDRAAIDAALADRTGPTGDVFDLERDRTGRHGAIMKYNLNAEAG